ncbi:MAG: MFS transporter [Candidatus Eremiobacteraeota bacterium]|nr:MFS transporter [Candidatus Eremiobacteraeota bacterium]
MAVANPIALARLLTPVQRKTFVAAFLGWTLDAFDFFIVTFVVKDIAEEFHRSRIEVLGAITLTLMLRPLGALIFGIVADKFGRRGPLMVNIVIYSFLELLSGFAPNFTIFLVLRALYGIAMGGEWGGGAALALESMPAEARGFFSGVLQEGYATGYLIAAIVFFLVEPHFGWRAMFYVGAAPALLVVYIRSQIPESDAWKAQKSAKAGETGDLFRSFLRQPMLFVYAIVLMAAFNFMSHGSQDLYPTFLRDQMHFDPGTTTALAIVANVGAIFGGMLFGAYSQSIGRRRAIVTAALVGILAIPLWVFSPSTVLLAVGAFVLQFFVQGAWGVIPVHLNELSPGEVRGTFPGFVYQLGNLISAGASQIEATFAKKAFPLANGDADYGCALATIMLVVFLAVAIVTAVGKERRGIDFAND